MAKYVLSKQAAQQVARVVREYEHGRRPTRLVDSEKHLVHGVYVAKTQAGGIAAQAADTPGSGTVDLYFINDAGTLEDSGEDVTAFNISAAAVAATTYIQLKQEVYSGKYLVDFEDC